MAGIGHNGGPPMDDMDEPELDFSDLEGMTVQEILLAGQKAIFVQLVGKVRSGQASHQEMSILRNILRDNGVVLGVPPEQPGVDEHPAELPSFEKPDWE